MFLDDVGQHFSPVAGYCNTATVGIPPRAAVASLRACLSQWEGGTLDPVAFDDDVLRARAAFADIVGTTVDRVAMPGAASISAGLVASCLPDDARVLCAREDFTSVLYPFLADDRLQVEFVPLDGLLDAIVPGIDMVAVSAVQSADGRVTDLDELADAADAAGARTFVDCTQAAGWLPVAADRFDVTACAAYKWLCAPRGVGFMTVREDVDWLVPRLAGWYASDTPWQSCYGPPLHLAPDAGRFTVSPAWFDVAATAVALEALLDVGIDRIHAHDVALANNMRARLDMSPSNSAIVSLATTTDPARDLAAAGLVTASRNGLARVSFHLTNTVDDAALAATTLAAHLGSP